MTLEKTLKLAGSFLKIARVFVIAIGIIVLFSILLVKGSNSIVISETTASVILGNLKVTLNQPQLAQQILNSNAFPFAIAIVASFCIVFYMGLRELGKIVEEALQSSVFGKNISKRLIHLVRHCGRNDQYSIRNCQCTPYQQHEPDADLQSFCCDRD